MTVQLDIFFDIYMFYLSDTCMLLVTIVFMYLALLKLTMNVNNLNSKTDYSIR